MGRSLFQTLSFQPHFSSVLKISHTRIVNDAYIALSKLDNVQIISDGGRIRLKQSVPKNDSTGNATVFLVPDITGL